MSHLGDSGKGIISTKIGSANTIYHLKLANGHKFEERKQAHTWKAIGNLHVTALGSRNEKAKSTQ